MGEVEEGFWEFRAALHQGVKEKLILAHHSPTLEAASIMNFSSRPSDTEIYSNCTHTMSYSFSSSVSAVVPLCPRAYTKCSTDHRSNNAAMSFQFQSMLFLYSTGSGDMIRCGFR
jgi:hypothetical protein